MPTRRGEDQRPEYARGRRGADRDAEDFGGFVSRESRPTAPRCGSALTVAAIGVAATRVRPELTLVGKRLERGGTDRRGCDTGAGMTDQLPELLMPDAAAWRAWLATHHEDPEGVRLVLAKKGVTEPTSLVYADALDEALCFGWIDGQVGRRDERTFYQRFTQRRVRSTWSQNNVASAERLISEGRMAAPGRAAIERAKADGRWDAAYAGSRSIEVPADLQAALDAVPAAAAAFSELTRLNRYAILYRVGTVSTPAARSRKIDRYVAMLARGQTLYPQGPAAGQRR